MRLLVTGAWQSARENIKRLEIMGHDVMFLQYEKDELPCSYDWPEGIIGNGLFIHHPVERFSNLKIVQLISAGTDRVDVEYLKDNGIRLYNARGVYSVPMAEYAVAGVLNLYRDASFFHDRQKEHAWEKKRNLRELSGKRVAIVGCGSVGTECAKRFKAFGCNITGVATSDREQEYFDRVVSSERMNEILPDMDILILCAPLDETTRGMINTEKLDAIKKGAILVNISRGPVVDTKALENALDSGKLSGAVLDVFDEEPLSLDSTLWDRENVIITPHNSFAGENNMARLEEVIFSNLEGI